MSTWLSGIHAIRNALDKDAKNLKGLYIVEGKRNPRIEQLMAMAAEVGLAVTTLHPAEMERKAGTRKHQGVIAQYQPPAAGGEHDLFELVTNTSDPLLLLVLDGVTDPHNLGACLRSADGAGVHGVIVPRDKATGITPVVRKVASGAAESVPFFQVTNLARTLQTLRDAGVWITGTSDHATTDLYYSDFTASSAIVMGAEGKGLRRLTQQQCDHLISIPMAGDISSLNVSVATGVVLFEAVRQRQMAAKL